jgi:hypothetical protein
MSTIGGDRQSAFGLGKHERLKTFPGIGNRPVTSRSQESSSARMADRWFFIAYDLENSLTTGLIIILFVYLVNKIYLVYYCKTGGHM